MSSITFSIINELKIDHEIPEDVIQILEQRFSGIESIFSGLSTAYQQRKYFKEEFNKIVCSEVACIVFSF